MQDGEHEPQSLTSTELQPPTPTSSLQLRLESQAGWLIQLSVRRHDQNGEKKLLLEKHKNNSHAKNIYIICRRHEPGFHPNVADIMEIQCDISVYSTYRFEQVSSSLLAALMFVVCPHFASQVEASVDASLSHMLHERQD